MTALDFAALSAGTGLGFMIGAVVAGLIGLALHLTNRILKG